MGNGDMFYINHNSSNFTIIDCCIKEENKNRITEELKKQSKEKEILRFISTHPDDDHIRGLKYLDEQMKILNFYCVKNEATKESRTNDFDKYCELRDSTEKTFYLKKGCQRVWLNREGNNKHGKHIGASGITILWPNLENEFFKEALQIAKEGGKLNNISPIIQYSIKDGAKFIWMGDLEREFMQKIETDIILPKTNILFAPHHGRESGTVITKWLEKMKPDVIVIGEAESEELNYYENYKTITQNTTGDILFDCETDKIHIYVESKTYYVDFLINESKREHDNYIGTLHFQ